MHNTLFHRLSAVIVVAGLAIALSACSSSGSKGAKTPAGGTGGTGGITIANFTFSPSPVKAGSTVTVTNNDTKTHTVTANDGSFDVRVDAGKTATFTAPGKPGPYKFHCRIHSFMKGTLTVT
jgi:plastocyanin